MSDDKEDIYKIDDDDDDSYEEKSSDKDELKTKLIKYGIIIFVGLIVLLLFIAIFFSGSKKSGTVTSKDVKLTAGEEYSLNYSKGSYTWESNNPNVAKVSDDGSIIGIKEGDATITVKVGNDTTNYVVHVDKKVVTVSNVKMEKNTIDLDKGKTYEMKVTFTPSDAKDVKLSWSSSNESVATVKDGLITAVAPGTCMITVKTENGNTDTCLVKVAGDGNYSPIKSIVIESTDVSLNKGTSYNLSYKVDPSDSVNLVEWVSSDEKIATVENGVVYAISGGEVTITAKSGKISKPVKVTVIQDKKQEKEIILNQNEIILKIGESYGLEVTNKKVEVEWSSSDDNIATVNQSGYVTPKSLGTTTITAKDSDGSYAECKVTIISKDTSDDKISLNTSTLSMNVGDKTRLTETVTPSNNVSGINWSSSNTSVATVNNGEVTAVSNGTAIITATLPNGEKAECAVTVSTKVVKAALVRININSVTLKVGATNQLTVTVLPSTTTDKSVTWSSSNTSVATVDKNGKVTAKAKGSAKIYAKTSNGIFDTCAVYVE